MKYAFLAALGVALIGSAIAQTVPAGNPAPLTPVAVKMPDSRAAAAETSGSSNTTQAAVRSHLEKHGYTDISNLQEDQNSVWRGNAMKDGKFVAVSVDRLGHIVSG